MNIKSDKLKYVFAFIFFATTFTFYIFFRLNADKKEIIKDAVLMVKQQNDLIKLVNQSVHNYSYTPSDKLFLNINEDINRLDELIKSMRFGGLLDERDTELSVGQIQEPSINNVLDAIIGEWTPLKSSQRKYISEVELISPVQKEARLEKFDFEVTEILSLDKKLAENLVIKYKDVSNLRQFWLIIFLVSLTVFIALLYKILESDYWSPLKRVMQVILKLSKGVLSEKVFFYPANKMGALGKAVDDIVDYQLNTAKVLEKIGNTEFNIVHEKSSSDDMLGQKIEEMRKKLLDFYDQDRKKSFISNWTSQGVAKFADILRNNSDDIITLTDKVLSELVDYMGANQGAIYLLENNKENQKVLNLISVYAWKRKKFLEKQIEIGEGLVGQSVLEEDTIYITDIPDEYIHITSGLGDANPNALLIVPLKVNKDIFGVIEIASFKEFEEYQIELVEKISETLASSISSVRANEHTRKLLKESQQLTEALKKQEEELRHNAEELQSTQESINQNIEKLDTEKKKNIAILETCADGVMVFDSKGEVEFFNRAAEEIWQQDRSKVLGNSVTALANLEIDHKDKKVFHIKEDGTKIPINVRTEIYVKNEIDDEIPVLMTISVNNTGNTYFYAAFVQSIAVELF